MDGTVNRLLPYAAVPRGSRRRGREIRCACTVRCLFPQFDSVSGTPPLIGITGCVPLACLLITTILGPTDCIMLAR